MDMRIGFELPFAGVPARLALFGDGAFEYKDYIIKFQFPGVSPSVEVASDLGLSFSPGLRSLFLYSPGSGTSTPSTTKFFPLPEGADRFSVLIQPWSKRDSCPNIDRVDLQIQAPWSSNNCLTVVGAEPNA